MATYYYYEPCWKMLDLIYRTVESLISWQSRDSISTVLCHSIGFRSPNEQSGATVEIKSRDCQDMRGCTLQAWVKFFPLDFVFPHMLPSVVCTIERLQNDNITNCGKVFLCKLFSAINNDKERKWVNYNGTWISGNQRNIGEKNLLWEGKGAGKQQFPESGVA